MDYTWVFIYLTCLFPLTINKMDHINMNMHEDRILSPSREHVCFIFCPRCFLLSFFLTNFTIFLDPLTFSTTLSDPVCYLPSLTFFPPLLDLWSILVSYFSWQVWRFGCSWNTVKGPQIVMWELFLSPYFTYIFSTLKDVPLVFVNTNDGKQLE